MTESKILKDVKKYLKKNNIVHSSKPVFLCVVNYNQHFREQVSGNAFCNDQINSLLKWRINQNFEKRLIRLFSAFAKVLSVNMQKLTQIECTQQDAACNKCAFFSF